MRKMLIILILSGLVYALDDATVPNTFTAGTRAVAADVNENFDSLETAHNRTIDTIEIKFIRFTDLNDGDTTLTMIKCDTIRSNPDIDSIRGYPYIDSAEIDFANLDGGNIAGMTSIDCDSINVGDLKADTIHAAILASNLTAGGIIDCDSINVGDLKADTIHAAILASNLTAGGIVDCDSINVGDLKADTIHACILAAKLTAGSSEIEGSTFDINGGDVSAGTISGSLTWSAAQDLNSQALTNVDINSGSVDGATVGAASASTGVFTSLTTGTKSIYSDAGELTLSSGGITVTGTYHTIDTEGDVALDTISTINGGTSGAILILHTENGSRDVFIADGGAQKLSANFTFSGVTDILVLLNTPSGWTEISRSDNE